MTQFFPPLKKLISQQVDWAHSGDESTQDKTWTTVPAE